MGWGAVVRNMDAGQVYQVPAHVVVNATGAWCDQTRGLLGQVPGRLKPSRGSHLLFARHRLPLEVALTGLSPDDGRPLFAVPHREGTLVGTTDVFQQGPLENPRPSRHEVDYLLRSVQHNLPQARLTLADVCGGFAGVRPIVDMAAEEPAEASREEGVWVERGLVSTAGGKLTTYRVTAAEGLEVVVGLLPDHRRPTLNWGWLRRCPPIDWNHKRLSRCSGLGYRRWLRWVWRSAWAPKPWRWR
ncbi:MAG: FAD-dependent oxidoreductase [Thermoanaerobaculum sp.]|nr:FAD-dependent oxidoreductase [Thermoanaerobaculum sp.]